MNPHNRKYGWPPTALAVGALFCAGLASSACVTGGVDDTAGRPTVYQDSSSVGRGAGVGIESQDIVSMTDRVFRDMLANPSLAGSQTPPRVIVDAKYFLNESSQRVNVNMITDRLRVNLNRAAGGRMVFIGRHYSDMVETEREIKNRGIVDQGSLPRTAAPSGADYRLGGRISSLDAVQTGSGTTSRFSQITFEMVDLETGQIVWSGIYEFRKEARDDIIYR